MKGIEGYVLNFLKQNERWATQAQATEPLVSTIIANHFIVDH
jgi:hypothetical protein